MHISNSYFGLGDSFYQQIEPTPVANPALFIWNPTLARQLDISGEVKDAASAYFSGNKRIRGGQSIALAYAGHQFGSFVPQLGDGRAHLLAELIDKQGNRFDLQLKGSGQTRFSRRGDGRCALKPALREFIMSEAMHALGVPTSRTLAVVTTGELVFREQAEPGAIVTRVAASHIRVGTFQYFAATGDTDSLQRLLDYTIQRHYPEIEMEGSERVLEFLRAVICRQIQLISEWMRIGFIHGVMNTDNTAISGETIDYGPCAMMGSYHPETVFSSIDMEGRYCFGNQPAIMQWNMARLAETLLPFVDSDVDTAVQMVSPLIMDIPEQYLRAFYQMMAKKLGFAAHPPERELIDQLLDIMQHKQLDYTQTFITLMQALQGLESAAQQQLGDWYKTWRDLRDGQHGTALSLMQQYNPLVIPRNHHMEAVLDECQQSNSAAAALAFLKVLRTPYQQLDETAAYQDLPENKDIGYRTFCGT